MYLIWTTALCAAGAVALGANDTLGLENGFTSFNLPRYSVELVKDSQTLSSLRPHDVDGFDFLPTEEYLEQRAANGQYQTGDLLFRYRTTDSSEWLEFDTAQSRQPVRSLPTNNTALAAASLQPTLGDTRLNVSRTWAEQDGDLTLTFSLANHGNSTITLGGLGFPITSDNIFTGRPAVDINAHDSLTDPYIGLDAGYVQMTRVNGMGPAMLVTPINHDSAFEAWDFLHEGSVDSDELGYETPNFEGYYQWMTHSLAYAEQEWNASTPWNPPSSKDLKPGGTLIIGVRFTLVEEISGIEQAVQNLGMPLAKSLPGYIIPSDLDAKLYLYNAEHVGPLSTEPANAFDIKCDREGEYTLTPIPGVFGRVSVLIPLPDGRRQTVQYHISHPGPVAVQEAGQFLNDRHWWAEESDPFGRGPSFMAIDHTDGVSQPIIQDYLARVWLSGETHEAGASWYTAALKQVAQPDAEQVDKLEEFVEKVMWKTIQHPNYTVPQSVFWYNPNITDYEYNPAYPWEPDVPGQYSVSWNIDRAEVTTRSYGYVFPASAYWALYRVGRTHPSMLRRRDWEWYLSQAYETVAYCFKKENGTHLQPLWNAGLMGETAFSELLKDLYREGWMEQATHVESLMEERSGNWSGTAIPFGSELGWDCTGEEGVYYWSQYFGDTATVEKTVRTIQGYDPLIAHWGYNGNARRYWDFQFGGKYDRMGMYRAGPLNGVP